MDNDFDPDAFLADSPPATKAPSPSDFDPDAFLAAPVAPVKAAPKEPLAVPVVAPMGADASSNQSIATTVQPSPIDQYIKPAEVTGPVQSIGQPYETPDIPTMGESSPEGKSALLGGGQFHQRDLERNKESIEGPVRAFTDSASANAMPYLAGAINAKIGGTNQSQEIDAELARSQQFQEDHPIASQLGGIGQFAVLPFQEGLTGMMTVGGAATALSTWLGSGMEASASDVALSGAEGAVGAGAFHVGMGQGSKALSYAKENYKPFGRTSLKMTALAKNPPPVLMTPQSVVDLHDSFGAIKLPEVSIEQAHAKSVIPNKSNSPADRYALATTLNKIATDPASVHTYEVKSLKDITPVGPGVEVHITPDGHYEATIHEVSGKGVGIFKEKIESPYDATQFRDRLTKEHPDLPITLTNEAYQVMVSDDAMFDAMLSRVKPLEATVTTYEKPVGGRETRAERVTPISVDMEAPPGKPVPQPALASVIDGYLQIHNLDTYKAQEASLLGRNIRAITTPKGVRYVKALFDADKGYMAVAPIDPEEGLKTILRVSRVPAGQVRELGKTELRKIVKDAKHYRDMIREGPNAQPDVHVEAPKSQVKFDGDKTFQPGISDKTVAGQDWAGRRAEASQPPVPPEPPSPMPEPLPPPDPPSPPPPFLKDSTLLDRLKKSLGKGYERVRRQVVQEGLRADEELGAVITAHQNMANMQAHQIVLQKALEARVGKTKIDKFREDVYEWAELRKTDEQMAKDHPEAWAAARDILRDWEATNREQQNTIVALGGIPEDYGSMVRDGKLWRYVTRSYGFDILPPAKRLAILEKDEARFEAAADGYIKWAKGKGRTLSKADAYAKIRQAMGVDDPATELFGETKSAKDNVADNLKKRNDELPQWYRDMLLQNRDGFYAIAKTDAVQKTTIANLRVWQAIANNPEWALPTLDGMDLAIAKTWKTLPINKKAFGQASGMHVSPEVYDALVTMPNAIYKGNELARAMVSWQKTNWFSFGKARTYVATILDNWWYGAMSGGVDVTRPEASGQAAAYAWKAISEYKKNPLAQNEWAQFIRDARRIGPDEVGHIGQDLRLMERKQERYFLEHMAKLPIKSNYVDVVTAMSDFWAKAGKPGSWVFETSDRMHRLASWKIIADDMMLKDNSLSREDALRASARKIFQYYPTYGKAAPLAKYLSRTAAGMAGPTALYGMERNRVFGSLPLRMVDDPAVIFRMAKMGLVFFDMFVASETLRAQIGEVSDEDKKATMNELGFGAKMFSPGVYILPFRVGGKVVPVDFTQIAGPLQYLAGDPHLGPVVRTFLNAGTGVLAGGMAGNLIDSGLNKMGVQTGFPDRPLLPGDSGGANVATWLANKGAIPSILPDVYGNLQNAGAFGESPTRKQESWPMSLSVARSLGMPVMGPVSTGLDKNPSFQAAISQDLNKIYDMESVIKMVAQWPEDKKLPFLQMLMNKASGDVEKQKVIHAAIIELKKAAINLGNTGKLESDARRIHSQSKASEIPRRIGVDKP